MTILQEFLHIVVGRFHGDTVKGVHMVIAADTVYRRHPELPFAVAQDILDLVVWQS